MTTKPQKERTRGSFGRAVLEADGSTVVFTDIGGALEPLYAAAKAGYD